ncbi:MAG: SDR family oxidoreductase [Cyclobacteriaceae bacterium]
MKILVTGANGLLGQKLASRLMDDPTVEPVFTARKQLSIPLRRGVFETLDITSSEQVTAVLTKHRPEVIIHTAAMTQVDDCEKDRAACWLNNVTATEYLAQACASLGIHMVHVSTDFIFDGKEGPLDEQAIPAPVNYYGESKLAAEKAVMSAGASWAILRTVLVYGVSADMSRSNIVLWVKKSLEEGKTIKVVNDQWRTPTLAEDLAQGCHLAAARKATGVFNISGEKMMTPYDIAITTARQFHLNEQLIQATDSTQFKQPAARPLKTGFIITKAKQELGYKPHSFEEGLALMATQLT